MMYHLTALLVAFLTFVSGNHVLAQTATTLAYDLNYDNADLPLNQIACSNGVNGLETEDPNYATLGSLPAFPFVGGVDTVSGWNSVECGACYAVTYGDVTVNILAVDVSKAGFTVSEEAMNTLTGGLAVELGRVDVLSAPVSPSACGMPSPIPS